MKMVPTWYHLERSQDLSIERFQDRSTGASLGVYSLPVVEKLSFDIRVLSEGVWCGVLLLYLA